MPTRVAYVARNDGTDVRVSKECNSLLKAGYDVHFIGWRRPGYENDHADPMPDVPKHFYIARSTSDRAGKARDLPAFGVHVAQHIAQLRPNIVHSVNEELGLLALLLQPIYGFRTVCDLFDSVELVWGDRPFPLGMLMRALARCVQRKSHLVIVTDEARKKVLRRTKRPAYVVANYPIDIGSHVAFKSPRHNGPARLYVAGSLQKNRGLESVLQLAEGRDDVNILSAGWLYDECARRFVEHRAVKYMGVVSPDESLRLASTCDAILALYEPSSANRVLASPNKIYDALCVGRPVIINREAAVSKWLEEGGIGYAVPYGDVAELGRVLDKLKVERSQQQKTAIKLRSFFEAGFNWKVAERNLLQAYAEVTAIDRVRG